MTLEVFYCEKCRRSFEYLDDLIFHVCKEKRRKNKYEGGELVGGLLYRWDGLYRV